MLHWIESEDDRGFLTWLRYVECSHWGLFFTEEQCRWLTFTRDILGPGQT